MDLRRLLSASSQRKIIILETLASCNGWTNLADLSLAVGASERTVANDISNLRKQWNETLNIEVSKKNGIILRNRNVTSIGIVFKELFNEAIPLRWIKELLFNPNHGIDYYMGKLFISRSTLTRLLPQINSFLSVHKMSIECKNNRYRLLGEDEQRLRHFSTGFILELFGLNPLKDDLNIDLDLESIKKTILAIHEKHLEQKEFLQICEDQVLILYWMLFYVVSLIREEQGFNVSCDYNVNVEVEIDVEELTYVQECFPNLAKNNVRPIHQTIISNYQGWDSEMEKALVISETEGFLQRVFSVLDVIPDAETKDKLCFTIKSLYFTEKFRPYETSTLFDRIYYFSLSLKHTSPHLYEIVEKNLHTFSQNTKIDLSSRISDVLFWLCLDCPEIYRFKYPKTALLISDFGVPHAKFLAKVFTGVFNNNKVDSLRIEIADYPQILTSIEADKYDFIITTTPNLPVPHQCIILIDDCPSFEIFEKIYQALSR